MTAADFGREVQASISALVREGERRGIDDLQTPAPNAAEMEVARRHDRGYVVRVMAHGRTWYAAGTTGAWVSAERFDACVFTDIDDAFAAVDRWESHGVCKIIPAVKS